MIQWVLYKTYNSVRRSQAMTWGEFIRAKRLEAGHGLREFAALVGIQPSNYNHMEKGRMSPPQDKGKLDQIAETLGIARGSPHYHELMNLAAAGKDKLPADVEEFAKRNEMVPVLLRTLDNRKLTEPEFRSLVANLNRDLTTPRKEGRADGENPRSAVQAVGHRANHAGVSGRVLEAKRRVGGR
jgi:transcriptional regulator with XRE-family HTH domain